MKVIMATATAPATETTDAQKATSEAAAFFAKVKSVLAEGSELGNLALSELAHNLGASGNEKGKPSESAFLAFLTAIAHRKALSGNARLDLCRKINSAVPAGHKPVAPISGKGNSQAGAIRYRINLPVSVDIALDS